MLLRRTGAGRTGRRLLFAAAVVVHVIALYAPSAPPGVDAAALPPGADKAVHVLLFAVVAVAGRLAGVPVRWMAAGLVAHAGVSEVLQHALLPHRAGDAADVLADLAGTAAGLLLPLPRARTPSCTGTERGTMAP